jgi:hypothetical protein
LPLLAVFLVGMAHIFFLPLWEGYDEPAHFSYVQELADTGRAPQAGKDLLSLDIQHYEGPRPYPELGVLGHPSYREFEDTQSVVLGDGPTSFLGAGPGNWEAQHPPLFYWLMVPVYSLTKDLGWKPMMLAMRTICWSIAAIGLWVLTLSPTNDREEGSLRAAALLWPLIAPEFFPEMSRLGNDSLCLFFASALWVLALRVTPKTGRSHTLASGTLLGLGLLTKAFFVPIGVGFLALVFMRRRGATPILAAAHVAGAAMVAALISSWWYVADLRSTGVFGGGNEFAAAKKAGLVTGLLTNFHFLSFAKGLFGIASTAAWAGTWSFAVYHAWMLTPLLLLPGIPLARWLGSRTIRSLDGAAPLFFLIPMLAGLIYHELAWIALGHSGGGTPGWYLHILAGPLSYAWARGWTNSASMRTLFGFTVGFSAILWACQLAVFSGTVTPDSSGHLPLSTAWWHIDPVDLSIVSYPSAATVVLVMAGGLAYLHWRISRRDRLERDLSLAD